jgi:flagellar export protein FliJ
MPKKQQYELQPILELREQAKKEAMRVVAERRERLRAAEEELARREQALAAWRVYQADCAAKMNEEARRGVAAHRLVAHRSYLDSLRAKEQKLVESVAQQHASVEYASAAVEAALDALVKAAGEAKVLEEHKAQWKLGVRREEARREQKMNDELGIMGFDARRERE